LQGTVNPSPSGFAGSSPAAPKTFFFIMKSNSLSLTLPVSSPKLFSADQAFKSLTRLALFCYRPCHLLTEVCAREILPLKQNASLQTIARRVLVISASILMLPCVIPLWLLGGLLDSMALKLGQYHGFTLSSGKCQAVKKNEISVLSFNTCMLWGMLPILFGGVKSAKNRVQDLDRFLKINDADVLLLQEVSRSAAFDIKNLLQDRYSYFVCDVALQPLILMDAGLFIASRQKILSIRAFNLPTNGTMRRALLGIELETAWVFTTHLEAGDEALDMTTRKNQMQIIETHIKELASQKPWLLAGDFNIRRTFQKNDEYSSSINSNFFENIDSASELSKQNATCTNELNAFMRYQKFHNHQDELIDYAFKSHEGLKAKDFKKIETFNLSKPETSLSDHKALQVIF
jgi:endonuclease/exonuclease/phosphatase family metal-dependent hydrolase